MSNPTYTKNKIALLVAATATGAFIAIPGGEYHLTAESSNWNSAVLSLEFQGPNGTTIAWPTVSMTANGLTDSIRIPAGTKVRAKVATGVPTALYANLVPYRHIS